MLSTDDQIVLALRRISQAIDQYSRQLWKDTGLTAPQLATLREIIAGRNATPMKLAEALHVSQPTITGILGRLQQQRLIVRERSATDRRSIAATATKKGKEVARTAPPLLRDRFRGELAKLPLWQQSEMLAMLQRVADMMHAPPLTEGPFLFHGSTSRDGARKSTKRKRDAYSEATAKSR